MVACSGTVGAMLGTMLPPIPASHLTTTDQSDRPLRLLSIVRARLRELRYSPRTEETYVRWIIQFVEYHGRKHPKDMGAPEVRQFLSALVLEREVAAATQNLALAAITFLYTRVLRIPLSRVDDIVPSKQPRRVPVVLTPSEIRAILSRLADPEYLAVSLMYGSGLRVRECVSLRVKDVDLERREIIVRGGKGNKDRRTPLAESCVPRLRRHLKARTEAFRNDSRLRIRTTGLDAGLARKYPRAEVEWR